MNVNFVYNPELADKLDENKYLLGFENGVYDFKQKDLETEKQKIMLVLLQKRIMFLMMKTM